MSLWGEQTVCEKFKIYDMKKYLSVLIALMACMFASAQDTIKFLNGRVEAVKVMEVGLGKVKYKKMENLNGPLYLLDEAEVDYIKYQNGVVEAFNHPEEEVAPVREKRVVLQAGPLIVERSSNVSPDRNDTEITVSRRVNSAKYPLRYRKDSPSGIVFDTEYISEQEAYNLLGHNYDIFRENVRYYRTGRAMWIAGIGFVFVSGPIAIGADINNSHVARHVALTALCSGTVLFSVGMARFVIGKRGFKNVLMDYNYDYNTKRQNVSELKFGLTGNGLGLNLTF